MSTQPQAIELQAKDLTPAGETFCPNPKAGMQLWNTHPRVFLDLPHGEAKCPFCGSVYWLKEDEKKRTKH